ncbi:Eukaryotic translation initiation factor 3 subunit A [Camellia lanceoleosa]|uniref:Eukaryotic translation initiation factor 3 subunit A n=1 Tax=Camellia lanceoleosa TaxID=1840588 RepID=A0ACC0GS01_9ERIC|nr:Eukaryotic translation initiation factor 3 subunit A [Camellia lanceoleosa]
MYWLTAKTIVVLAPRWRSLSLLLRSLLHRRAFTSSPPLLIRQYERIHCLKERKLFKGTTKATRKHRELNNVLDDKDHSHILWWKERMQLCRKPSSVQLIKRLMYTNLLGLDVNLKNGSLKEGTLDWEILQFKSKFPCEVFSAGLINIGATSYMSFLFQVGGFYEAIGIDACILVEYAGLNPFVRLRSDSIPRAGCPVVQWICLNGIWICAGTDLAVNLWMASPPSSDDLSSESLMESHTRSVDPLLNSYSDYEDREAFRSVEGIHGLMCMVKKTSKASLMAVYYAKLTEIFWVSGSHLYHAYAWFKLFSLQKSFNKNLSQKDLQLIASSVVLAALSVAPYDNTRGASHLELEHEKEQNLRMANLIGFIIDPKLESREVLSRSSLLTELIDRIARVAFETIRKRGRKLCSVDKANVYLMQLVPTDTIYDTFPLGCAFDESIVHHKYFEYNLDSKNSTYSTKNGIYLEGCGLDNVMIW